MAIPQYFDSRPYQDIADADMLGIGDLVFDDGSRQFVNGDPEVAATFPPLPDMPEMGTDTGLPAGIKINLDGSISNAGGADVAPPFSPQNSMALDMGPEPAPPPPVHEPMGITAVGANQGSTVNGITPIREHTGSQSSELPPDIGISMDGRIVPKGSPDDGMVPFQREGAMPADLAAQQGADLGAAQANTLQQTGMAREAEGDIYRQAALKREGELYAERVAREEELRENQEKQERVRREEQEVADLDIKTDLASAKGSEFGGFLTMIGAALLGATGSDAGIRMIESTIERHVRKQVSQRDTKLNILAKKLNSTEQAIAAGKAELYRIGVEKADNLVQLTKADAFEAQTPAVIAAMAQKHTEQMQEFQRLSLGKTIERAPVASAPKPAQVQKYGEAAASQQKSQQDAQRALRAIGGVYDPKTGKITNRDEILKKGIPGVGKYDSFFQDIDGSSLFGLGSIPKAIDNATTSQGGQDARAALEALVAADARAANPNGVISNRDMIDARNRLGLNTEKGTLDAIERTLNAQPQVKQQNASAFGPDVAQTYEQRQRAQGVQPSTDASPAPIQMLQPGQAREQLRQQPQSQSSGMPEPYNNAMPIDPKARMAAIAGELQTVAGQELPPEGLAILLAQSGHETADGKQMPKGNFFGHKATAKSSGSANLETTEGEGADAVRVKQNFATYETPAESAADHIDLLKRRYPRAWEALQAGDESAYVAALKDGGYFTGSETAYLKRIQERL